jgi:hypothetical protein
MEQQANSTTRPGIVQVAIIMLVISTAMLHLMLLSVPGLGIWFLLNAIGYVALMIALYLPQLAFLHRLTRYALVAYAALTLILWYVISGHVSPLALITKTIEIVLIALLLLEDWQEQKQRGSRPGQESE